MYWSPRYAEQPYQYAVTWLRVPQEYQQKRNAGFMKYQGSSAVEIDTQLEAAIVLAYYKQGQSKEWEQYLESTFRMISKMIDNLSRK